MRYCGVIGFATTSETSPGIWTETITERKYFGDVIKVSRSLAANSDSTNDNVNISNSISIVSDPFARNNIYAMRYLTWMNSKWKITNVEVDYPRLTLSIGGLYNGDET